MKLGLFRIPGAPRQLSGFDPAFYARTNPDVVAAGVDPLAHFLTFGWKEGRNPNAYFSCRGYLEANPDVEREGMNPLLHFLEFGMAEGRAGWQTRQVESHGLAGLPAARPRMVFRPG